ncbi:MAG TPA: hypothetical protein VFV50_05975 [Bdellovibrionales bacterium]|nr:hypothetical protein [Bdellovibrionales bacterium]
MNRIFFTAFFALAALTQTANAQQYRDPQTEDFLGTYDGVHVEANNNEAPCVVNIVTDPTDSAKLRVYARVDRLSSRPRTRTAGPFTIPRSKMDRVASQVVDDRGLQGNTIRADALEPRYLIDLIIQLGYPTANITTALVEDTEGDIVSCTKLVKRLE